MILISKIRNSIVSLVLVGLFFLVFPFSTSAQESLTLSVSPTLFDMSAEPGQAWQSNLRVVNVNNFDLILYVEVVNFAPKGEGGDGTFVPIQEDDDNNATLADWIDITKEAIIVPREKTVEIPFTVTVPIDASPGGHFAAFLVGTKPVKTNTKESKLQTAQIVTSLFFARVAGDVVELGNIREFSIEGEFLNSPEATFSLRFENRGNVHLQPQGEIKITNMWGQERGLIPINQFTNFGNVLPDSIRRFVFTWKGEWSMSDIGRYTAIATLGYGKDEKKFASSQTNFWVIPYKILFGIVLGLTLFFSLISWLVRIYVRHTLTMAGISLDDYRASKAGKARPGSISAIRRLRFRAPVEAGLLDLTDKIKDSSTFINRLRVIISFIFRYKLFFFGVTLIILFLVVIVFYVKSATTEHRAFEVVYVNSEATTSLSSEELIYKQLKFAKGESVTVIDPLKPTISILNRSGVPGLGAETAILLEVEGYRVGSLSADFTSPQKKTVIVCNQDKYNEALVLSGLVANALVSARPTAEEDQPIIIFLGTDLSQ